MSFTGGYELSKQMISVTSKLLHSPDLDRNAVALQSAEPPRLATNGSHLRWGACCVRNDVPTPGPPFGECVHCPAFPPCSAQYAARPNPSKSAPNAAICRNGWSPEDHGRSRRDERRRVERKLRVTTSSGTCSRAKT